MKKILCSIFCFILITSNISVLATNIVTMYSADGRTIKVNKYDVNAYENVGWYTVPVKTMFAPDGRTIAIAENEVNAYINVGWYTVPVQYMYAPDGRSIVIDKNEVDAYTNVGWYIVPVTAMYSLDGRQIVVATSEVEAYKAVGWYEASKAFGILQNYIVTNGGLNSNNEYVLTYAEEPISEFASVDTFYTCTYNCNNDNIYIKSSYKNDSFYTLLILSRFERAKVVFEDSCYYREGLFEEPYKSIYWTNTVTKVDILKKSGKNKYLDYYRSSMEVMKNQIGKMNGILVNFGCGISLKDFGLKERFSYN